MRYIAILSVIFAAACGGEEIPSTFRELAGTWTAQVRATPVFLGEDVHQNAPKPMAYSTSVIVSLDGITATISGLCPDAPQPLNVVDSGSMPSWNGGPIDCAHGLVPGFNQSATGSYPTCDNAVFHLSNISIWADTDGSMKAEGAGHFSGCSQSSPAWETVLVQVTTGRPDPS